MPVSPPLTVKESDGSVTVRPTNVLSFNAADFTVAGSGDTATISIDSTGTGAALTASYIGFGAPTTNLLTGSANFTFVDESGGSGPAVLLQGDQPKFSMKDDTAATTYNTDFVQSGASMFIFGRDSTGTDVEMIRAQPSSVVFNDDGTAMDLRHEASGGGALLWSDAGRSSVGIGVQPDSGVERLHVQGTGTSDLVMFESTDAGTATAPDLVFYRSSATPAANDYLGRIDFRGKDSGANDQNYGIIAGRILTATGASEDGAIYIKAAQNGDTNLAQSGLAIKNTQVVVNDGSASYIDFVVNGDNVPLISTSAGQDNVGIGGTPGSTKLLHIIDDGTKAVTLSVESTDGDADVGPVIQFNRNSGSPADGDSLGALYWSFDDDGGGTNDAGFIKGYISDASAGSEDADFYWYANSGGSQYNMLSIRGGIRAVEVNVNNADVDFIANGDTVADLLFVDASGDRVGIGGSPSSGVERLHIKGTAASATDPLVRLEVAEDGALSGPIIDLYRNSGTPANGDNMGEIFFRGNHAATSGGSSAGSETYGRIRMDSVSVQSSSENSILLFDVVMGGTLTEFVRLNASAGSGYIVFNEGSKNIDFRVESDGNANMFKVDGGNNLVSVGASATSGGATFQVPDNTISSYANVNAVRTDSAGTMTFVNADCQGQTWVHDSGIAWSIDLPDAIKGMHFKIFTTAGALTIDPNPDGGTTNLANGATGTYAAGTAYQLYNVIAFEGNGWVISK